MPCCGKWYLISRRITASAARSASVTGSKSVAWLLLSIDSEVRKNGRMVSPEEVARRPRKAEKSMTVTSVPWSGRAGGRLRRNFDVLPNPILPYPHADRQLSAGILNAESRRRAGIFSDNESDHEIERLPK